MKRISLCGVLLAATFVFIGCALLDKKDPVPVASNRSADLSDKKPIPDAQNALSSSATTPDTQNAMSQPASRMIPAPEAQKTEKPAVTYLITIKNGCNVRSEPNGKSKVMTTLKRGQKLQQIDQLENWYNIILPSGEKGWIHKDLVKNSFPVLNGSLQTNTSESQKTTTQPQEKDHRTTNESQETTTQPQEKEHRTTENVWSAAWQGAGFANKISENTYSVQVIASIWSENTANMYKQWDAASKKACNGRAYKVTERQYVQGSGRENRQSKIIGTIECTK